MINLPDKRKKKFWIKKDLLSGPLDEIEGESALITAG